MIAMAPRSRRDASPRRPVRPPCRRCHRRAGCRMRRVPARLLLAGRRRSRGGERDAVLPWPRTRFPDRPRRTAARWTASVGARLCDSFYLPCARPLPAVPTRVRRSDRGAGRRHVVGVRPIRARHRGAKRIAIRPAWSVRSACRAALLVHVEIGETAGRVAAALPRSPAGRVERGVAGRRSTGARSARARHRRGQPAGGETSAGPCRSIARGPVAVERITRGLPGDRPRDPARSPMTSTPRCAPSSTPCRRRAAGARLTACRPRVDAACPAEARRIDVLGQRGACGIDGLVAGAAGSASAAGRPTAVLLAMSASRTTWAAGRRARRRAPLAIVVIDTRRRSHFEQLPWRARRWRRGARALF